MKRSLTASYNCFLAGLALGLVAAPIAVCRPALADTGMTTPGGKPPLVGSKPDPFPLSSKFSRRLQRYTGINWLTGALASQAAGLVIQHKLGGHVKVKVKTYSFTDLLAGKIKSLSIDVKGPKLSGVSLGEVSLKSANPIWYAYRKDKSGVRGLKSPVILMARANLSQKQIARALENPGVTSKLHGLKLDLPGLGRTTNWKL